MKSRGESLADHGFGTPHLQKQVERVVVIQLRGEKAPGRPCGNTGVLKIVLQERWRGNLH